MQAISLFCYAMNCFFVFTLVDVSPAHPSDVSPSDVSSVSSTSEAAISHSGPANHDVHSGESLQQIVNRLSRLEGHIRGVKAMVQEHRPCPDVLIQVAAVRGGLDKVARIILDEHLSACIARAVEEGNIEEEVEALKKALDRFIA